jgi:hypothetical protein
MLNVPQLIVDAAPFLPAKSGRNLRHKKASNEDQIQQARADMGDAEASDDSFADILL